MAGLVAYGAGLGLFIAPNNSATLAAAPTQNAGQAGGLLNLMRAFGTATGVASASALLAWRLERATGLHERTVGADERALLDAAGDVMLLIAAFAVLAAIACSLRDKTCEAEVVGEPAREATENIRLTDFGSAQPSADVQSEAALSTSGAAVRRPAFAARSVIISVTLPRVEDDDFSH